MGMEETSISYIWNDIFVVNMLSWFLFLCLQLSSLPPLKLCRRDRRTGGRTEGVQCRGFTAFILPVLPLLPTASSVRLKPCPSCLPAQVQQHTGTGCTGFFLYFAVIILVLFCSVGLHETLALLTSQLHPDTNHKEDLVFLKDVFSEKSLSYIMKVDDLS